ncbi:MAG: hypothetical protein WCK77_10225 [Verrucomicrobiota bacterium]
MSNLTEDLRRYRELEFAIKLFREKLVSSRRKRSELELNELLDISIPDNLREEALQEASMNEDLDEALKMERKENDRRELEISDLEERIANIAVESPTVVIDDRELHQLFHEIRQSWIKYNILSCNGSTVTEDLFEKLDQDYHPKYFVARLVQARPLITLIEIPQDVIDLLVEARTAFCLRLPTACISVCRSTIERAVVDIAVRIGRLKESDVQEGLRMCEKISSLIARDLTPQSQLRRELDEFLANTSRVIHSNTKADEPLALKLYLKALELTQMLYGRYAKQLKIKPIPLTTDN